MPINYERHLHELIADQRWQIDRFAFATELVFRLIRKL
jgi:hypothetical protein